MPASSILDFADPDRWRVAASDRRLFDSKLAEFVPADAFDAHAHLYDLRHLDATADLASGQAEVGRDRAEQCIQQWMGELAPTGGLYFPFPTASLDCDAANAFLAEQVRGVEACRGLMMIRPSDDPAMVEAVLTKNRFAGFKVYHVFADRSDSFDAEPHEYLPEWAWELAHQYGLWITLHLVLPQALSDPRNSSYLQRQCRRWPQANLVLAHAARGFNASHTINAVDLLRGVDNVYFDTSAICEPSAFEAIIRTTGVTRLMYGSDFPVSQLRGKAISSGDGFAWLYKHNFDWSGQQHGSAQLIGIESLLALQQAARTCRLRDGDLERIFRDTARQLLRIDPAPDGERVKRQYQQAKQCIPGGGQLLSKRPEMYAPDQWPAYYEQAIGCEVVDTSGRRFTDMSSNGILACLLGFADPDVNDAVIRRVQLGSMCSQQSADELRLAELLLELHPWASGARFARTGGEAAAIAVRLARAATGRDAVAICGYHGWHDWYLAANLNEDHALDGHLLPGLKPAGVPRALTGVTFPFAYNQLDQLDQVIAAKGGQLAAIVMEPMRNHSPEPGFLEGVRERADQVGAKLIFDEISIGWRRCLGGAHLLWDVQPDLAVFAKSISNGFAMSAVIGATEAMDAAHETFISSAYWSESIGPAAAVATIEKLRLVNAPHHIAAIGRRFRETVEQLANEFQLPLTVFGRDDSVSMRFEHPQADALQTLLTTRMLEHGFLAAAGFSPTMAHQPHHVERYHDAARIVFGELREALDRGDLTQRLRGPVKHAMFKRLAD